MEIQQGIKEFLIEIEVRKYTPRTIRGSDVMATRDRTMLTMLSDTWIRCLELCSIRPSDIHEDYIIIRGKNHKQRVVPITPILRKNMVKYEAVKESYFRYKNTDDTYFLSFHGRALTVSAVEVLMKKYGSGIEGIRVSPHEVQ